MVKLYDSEIKVMNLLWEKGSMKAADIAKEMERRIGWNKNTTYTVIKKCVSKGAIERREPGFVCVPVVEKIDIQRSQTKEFLQKVFDGSSLNFLSFFLSQHKLDKKELDELEQLIEEYKEEEQ
jgi:BlaI family penicillinase repressor